MPWVLDRAMKRHLFLLAALTAFSPVPSRAQSDDLAYCNTLYDLAAFAAAYTWLSRLQRKALEPRAEGSS